MKIYYGKAVYDQKEIQASLKVLKVNPLLLLTELEVKILKIKNQSHSGRNMVLW